MLHLVTRDLITHIIPALCPSVQALQSEMLLDGVFVKADEMWGHLLPLLSPASALPALLWHIAADQFRVPLKFVVQSAQAHLGGLDPLIVEAV